MLATHSLTADDFMELAVGEGGQAVVGKLRAAQHSKHLMLLLDVHRTVRDGGLTTRAAAAFRVGFALLDQARAADAEAVATLLSLPYVGSWAHDCRVRADNGLPPDFGYLATVAAAAAIPLHIPFDIEVPVRNGCVALPGLGSLLVAGDREWIGLSSDGELVRAGEQIEVACSDLVPDDASGDPARSGVSSLWRGTPLVRARADGRVWEVLLESADIHLDRYSLPMLTTITTAEVARWRQLIQSTWELLVRHHDWAARPIADGVTVIVPLVARTDPHSAASPAAFGAIAASAPVSPVGLAETLIHEFQHVKLGGVTDIVPLVANGGERGYAPWREDPRPMGGLLQGVYAFAGIAHFWDVQRRVVTDPDDILRASVLYERWRSTIELVSGALLEGGALTANGAQFVSALRARGRSQRSEPVSAEAREIAAEVALDNLLVWQLRHTGLDPEGVDRLVAAFLNEDGIVGRALPDATVERDIRKVESAARTKMLNMRFQEPRRYRQLSAAGASGLGPADALLIEGDARAAVVAYRASLVAAPDAGAWVGLALALNRDRAMALPPVFASHLPLLFEMHASMAEQGVHADPLDVAAWFE